jgi:hypothetical protein
MLANYNAKQRWQREDQARRDRARDDSARRLRAQSPAVLQKEQAALKKRLAEIEDILQDGGEEVAPVPSFTVLCEQPASPPRTTTKLSS